MPLNKSCSQEAFDENVSMLVKEGYEQKQALAISFSTLRKACGIDSKEQMTTKEIISRGKKEDVMDVGEQKGMGGSAMGRGGEEYCKCSKCGYEMKHERGKPCNEFKCPKCGEVMGPGGGVHGGKKESVADLVNRLNEVIERKPVDEQGAEEKAKSSWPSKVKAVAMNVKGIRDRMVDAASSKDERMSLEMAYDLLQAVIEIAQAMYGSKAVNVTRHLEKASDALLGYWGVQTEEKDEQGEQDE